MAGRAGNRSIIWISVGLVVLFGALVALLWALGLFDAGRSNAQVVSAALALVGGLVAASLTFVGVLLKNSIDERTLRQTEETEARLKLETSIRAVELLTEDGKTSSATRQAGALFVLASLGQLEFSLALLREIWAQRQVSPGAAVWVVDHALIHGSPSAQEHAAAVLDSNAADLVNHPSCFAYPDSVDLKWRPELPMLAREALLNALVQVVASKPREAWEQECVNALLVQFSLIWTLDPDSHIRNGALLGLSVLLDSPFYKDQDTELFLPSGPLRTAELRVTVEQHLPRIDVDVALSIIQRTDALRETWCVELEPETETET